MNQLQITLMSRVKLSQGQPDNRYRCLVTLIRSDRPRYWNFNCHNCQSKVVELMNTDVIAIDDFYDPQNTNNMAVGRHCKGTDSNGLPCKYSYFFVTR